MTVTVTEPRVYRLQSGSLVQTSLPRLETTLIVVPVFLMDQWNSYIRTQTNLAAFQYTVLFQRNDVMGFLNKTDEQISSLQVILCTPDVYQVMSPQYHFKRLVFDEIDTIKIPNCEKPFADMIWGVSSNKEHIMNAQTANRYTNRQQLKTILMHLT